MSIYLEPKSNSIFEGQPPKQGLFQSKQGLFGFQVFIYIYTSIRYISCIYKCIAREWHKRIATFGSDDADSRIVAPSLFGTHTTSAPDTVFFWSAED